MCVSVNRKEKMEADLIPSDFDVACSRAGVTRTEDDVLKSGSPPNRSVR